MTVKFLSKENGVFEILVPENQADLFIESVEQTKSFLTIENIMKNCNLGRGWFQAWELEQSFPFVWGTEFIIHSKSHPALSSFVRTSSSKKPTHLRQGRFYYMQETQLLIFKVSAILILPFLSLDHKILTSFKSCN